MNKIKNTVAFVIVCLLAMCAFAKKSSGNEKVPEFENSKAYVFSAEHVGKYKDNIRFINHSEREKLLYKVYMYNEKTETWFLFGTSTLKKFGDTDIVSETKDNVKIKKYRYLALVLAGGDARDFYYDLTVEHDDLYIYVNDK